jgi:hypothetical protein
LADFFDQAIDDFDIADKGLSARAIDDRAMTDNEGTCMCHESQFAV